MLEGKIMADFDNEIEHKKLDASKSKPKRARRGSRGMKRGRGPSEASDAPESRRVCLGSVTPDDHMKEQMRRFGLGQQVLP